MRDDFIDRDDDESQNERNIAAFCEQFRVPVRYCKTDRINGRRVFDAWMAAHWDKERGVGMTAVAYNGQCQAYIEVNRPGDSGAELGQIIAGALGLLNAEGPDGQTT